MKVKIRKATRKDLNNVLGLWKNYEEFEESITNLKIFPNVKKKKDAERNMRANFSKVLKSKKAEIFVAEEGKEVVGFLLISRAKNDDIHDFKYYGELHYMFIAPSFRKKGIASKLFKQAKKWFNKFGLKYLKLDVNVKNKKAHKIYKKWGFHNHEIGMWGRLNENSK